MRRIAIGLFVFVAVTSCGSPPREAAPELRPVRAVTVASAQPTVERTLAGVARAGVESRLSFRVGGTVQEVAVRLGDEVVKGQPMARLDPVDAELRVEEAEAALAQGRAGLRRAEADYDRVRALYENNNASKAELDAARAAAESARAQVDAVAKQVEQARQALGYTVLYAPTDGAVAAVEVEVNENVGAGQGVFLLTSGDRPEIVVGVPEVFIEHVTVGMPVRVTLGALHGRSFAASVSEVGVATAGGSTFEVTVRCDEPADEIRSGMAADVAFAFATGDAARVVVPSVAVGEDAEGRFVLVLEAAADGTGVVRRRAVTTGQLAGGIEILDGLAAGETIVTAGVRRLSDGDRVALAADRG